MSLFPVRPFAGNLAAVLALVGASLFCGQAIAQNPPGPTAEQQPGNAAPARQSSREMLTASDEPEVRRRARLRLSLAIGYFEQGKTTIALDELKQVIVIDPTFAEAFDMRGLIYMRLNDARLAEESFRKAMSLDPRDANVLHNYGWFLCQNERYGEAKANGPRPCWRKESAKAGKEKWHRLSKVSCVPMNWMPETRSPDTTLQPCCIAVASMRRRSSISGV